MYWILDVLVLLFLGLAIFFGYKRGFVKAAVMFLAVLLLAVVAIALGVGFLLLCYKVGGVNNFAYALLDVFGETNGLFGMLGLQSFDVCQLVSAILFLIFGLIIGVVVVVILGKLLHKLIDKIPSKGAFGIVTGVLGAILYVVLLLALIFAILGITYGFSAHGRPFSSKVQELYDSCAVVGFLSKINPLNGLFESLAESILQAFGIL